MNQIMNYTDILNVLFKKISNDINDYSSLIFNIQKMGIDNFIHKGRGYRGTVGSLCDSLRRNLVINNVDGILGHDNKIIANFENFLNGTGIFLLALDKQLLVVLANADKCLLCQRSGPIIQHDWLVLRDGNLANIL